jgi:hypothetical protein
MAYSIPGERERCRVQRDPRKDDFLFSSSSSYTF